jgi:hypothetical protein
MVTTGHAEFAELAVKVDDAAALVRDYEGRVASGELGRYAPSKPPGQILLSVATERVANAAGGPGGRGARLRRLRDFASYAWPVASMLVLWPLHRLARLLAGPETATLACLLYVLVPAVLLITLHTDQAFFPLLATLPLLLAAEAARRGSSGLGGAAGAAAYLALFCSFGLIPTVALAAVVAGVAAGGDVPGGRGRLGRALAGLFAGLLSLHAAFRWGLGYDAVARFRLATSYHQAWKGGTPGLGADLGFACVDALEFALWLGLPLTLLALGAAARGIREWRGLRTAPVDALALALLGTVVALAVFGKTQGEVARLWLFLVPVLCLVAAHELRRFSEAPRARVLSLLLLLQGGTVYLAKRFMDFA